MSKRNIQLVVCIVYWVVYVIPFSGYLHAEEPVSFPTISDMQKATIEKQIQEAIHTADKMFKNGQDAESFRILFDAHREEKKARLPRDAYSKIYDKILYLAHQDQSPLMRLLREPDYAIQEKNKIFEELKALAEKNVTYDEGWLFRNKYRGPLVQLMISQILTVEEKGVILSNITHIVQDKYTSASQKERVLEQSAQFVTLAEQKLNEMRYSEAFRIIWDNVTLENESGINSEQGYAYNQLRTSLEFLLHKDNSALLVFFRNVEVPLQEKMRLFIELQKLAQGIQLDQESILLQKNYQGPLIQLMNSDLLTIQEKFDILRYIQDGIEKEYSPLP